MSLSFDHLGHIKPDKIIPISLSEIESIFVTNFPSSETRLGLFNTLIDYLTALEMILKSPMHIFIDGSFVTKKENPNDIDLVVFIDYEIFNQNEEVLRGYRCNLKQRKLINYVGIDAYIEKLYPFEHPHYNLDYLHWLNFFSKDRKGRKKGFLLLELNEESREKLEMEESINKELL